MLNSILNALAGMLHLDRLADRPSQPDTSTPRSARRIELLCQGRPGKRVEDGMAAAPMGHGRGSCWQHYAAHIRALFALPRRRDAGDTGRGQWAHLEANRAWGRQRNDGLQRDLRGQRIELDRLWMSFEGTALDGASLALSDKALAGIAANADISLPAALCMALQSIATIHDRHADIRRTLLGQIVGALASQPRGISAEVTALLDAYHHATTLFADVPGIDALRSGARTGQG